MSKLLFVFPLLMVTASAAAQKRALVPEDLYRIKTASDVVVSPDGRWVVYVQTTIDSVRNRYVRDLYAARSDGTTQRRLTWTPEASEGSPAFSPDGKSLAFTARREGDERAAEIYVLPFSEPGEARRVTKIARGTSRPVWSPDGTRIAFTVSDSVAPDTSSAAIARNARKSDPRVITRLSYVGEQSFNEERWSQIYVVDASQADATAKRITSGNYPHGIPTWSADSKWLVFGALVPRDSMHADFEQDTDLYIAAADGSGNPRKLTGSTANAKPTTETNPRFSRDGKWLAYTRGSFGEHAAAANNDLIVANADGSTPACVTCGMDRSVGAYAWDTEGNLYFTIADKGSVHLYRSTKDALAPQKVVGGIRGVLGFDVNGGVVAWHEMKPDAPSDVYAADVAFKRTRRLTALNDSLLATVHVQPYEEVWYSGPDGYKLQGWIMRPAQGASRNTPLAVEMHGGPHVMWGPGEQSMWLEYQALAGAGYTVFFSNPRGSEGYGFEHKKAIHRNWGNLPMGDVLAGADTVIARGLLHPNKQVITGGSYAGYLTAWIIGHTNRFKAAVAQRGVYDMVTWWGMANTWRLYESEFGSAPWQDPELAVKASPITYARNINTPLLLLHGEQDYRVGLGGVQTLFRMLKAQGKEAVLVLYPREGHELTRSGEPHHRVDHMLRIVDWFNRYVKPR